VVSTDVSDEKIVSIFRVTRYLLPFALLPSHWLTYYITLYIHILPHLNPEDGSDTFQRNVGNRLEDYAVSEPDDQARQLKITLAPKVLYRPERSKFK
jgi:hypothetical protein